MKIHKLIFAIFMATAAVFVACEDFEDTENLSPKVIEGCQGIYFPSTNAKVFEMEPTNPTEITLNIAREVSAGAVDVPISVMLNDSNIFVVPETVSFADGDTLVDFTVTFPGAAEGITYNLSLVVEGETFVNPYISGKPYMTTNITRIKWTPIVDPMIYVDGTFAALYGVDIVPMYANAEKAEVTGMVRYRFKNAYKVATGSWDGDNYVAEPDAEGIYDGYPSVWPGEFDDTKDWYTTIEINNATNEVFMYAHEIGVAWSYGMMSIGSVYKNLSQDKGKYPLGKLANDVITFPANSLYFSMADYNDGGKYPSGTPTIIYLTKDAFVAANMKIENFNDVEYEVVAGEVGLYESAAFSTDWNQTLSKAIDIDAENDESEYKDLYYLEDLYAADYGLAFYYKDGGLLKVVENQATGVEFLGNPVFVSPSDEISSGVEVTAKGVTVYTLGLMFHYADGTILGDFAEKFYYSEDAVTFGKADFIGDFNLTGPSLFQGDSDADMDVSIAQGTADNELVITGIKYAAEVLATFDPVSATMTIEPQALADYGTYDMTLLTYDGAVSNTSPIDFTMNVLGNIVIAPTSPAFGYLLRSEAAGGYVNGYYDFVLTRVAKKSARISEQSASILSVLSLINDVKIEEFENNAEPNFKIQGKVSPKKVKGNISNEIIF